MKFMDDDDDEYILRNVSGGTNAVNKPGHFEVRNILQLGHPDALFSSKKS